MPTRNVLIVDPNVAFAEILEESLDQIGGYSVSVASTGQSAVALAQNDAFHLAIIDTLLSDSAPSDLLTHLRAIDPYLHIVFIPPFGKELEEPLAALDIQGVLHKPFIASNLDALLQSFLRQEVLTAPPSRADVVRAHVDELSPLMDDFCREVSAQLAALICQEELVVYSGRPPYDRGEPLVELILDNFEVSNRLATFLGEPEGHFDLSSYVSDTLSLYALSFGGDLTLVVVPGSSIPPGVVHLNIKRVVEEISRVLG